MLCVSSTDPRTTNHIDVNWTLCVISQCRLTPLLLMTPRITQLRTIEDVDHRNGWTQIFSGKACLVLNSKSDFEGHSRSLVIVPFDRPHTISH